MHFSLIKSDLHGFGKAVEKINSFLQQQGSDSEDPDTEGSLFNNFYYEL